MYSMYLWYFDGQSEDRSSPLNLKLSQEWIEVFPPNTWKQHQLPFKKFPMIEVEVVYLTMCFLGSKKFGHQFFWTNEIGDSKVTIFCACLSACGRAGEEDLIFVKCISWESKGHTPMPHQQGLIGKTVVCNYNPLIRALFPEEVALEACL